MKQHPPSAFIAGGERKNKKIRIRGQKSKADNTLCIGVNNNIKVISVYKVTHSQAMCLLHHHKHITILVLHEIIFCIALYPSHVIYSTTRHSSGWCRIYKDTRKFWNKWWPAEKKIWKCKERERDRKRRAVVSPNLNEFMHSKVK